ncbi:LTA synthase family protein, partial [Alistipes ihumii]
AGVALTLGGIRGGFSRQTRPITLSNATLYTSSDRKANLILSNPFCLLRTLGNRSLSYTRFFDSETLDSLYSPYHDPKPDTTALGPRNIVIFVLESFSSEHSALLNPDLYPNGRGFTPFLDSLMREGYCFPNAFANGHKSIEALPSVLSSIPSYRTPFVLMPQALAETKALPALLADEGYSTSFFNGSGRGSMGFGAYATLAGVQRYYSREDYEKVCGTGDFDGYWGIWDEPFLQYMSRTLSETPEPFFASAFTLTSHHPFVVPERYADTLPKGKTKVHQGVAYTDMALKKFMETSSKEPWFRRTIFVFVADHVSSETFAPKTLTPTGNTRIVCLIYTPDGSVRGRHEGVVQQIDLMPTLLGLLGYDKPYFAFGRDVLHETGRTAMATNSAGDIYQGITDSLVLFFDGERTTSAYLRSDTLQRQDVSDRRTPLLEEAERQLKARLQQYYEHVERRDYLAPEQKTPPTGRAER